MARLLAQDSTRQSAVSKILASRDEKLSLLLSWANRPPDQVDEYGLSIGLADIFGQLKTKEAIPFLIKNIGRRRTRNVDFAPWLKTDDVIKMTFPAVAALIQIGSEASRAVMHAFSQPMVAEDRVAAIFVVSRIEDSSEAKAFLNMALGEANQQRYWAEEGLKRLAEGPK